MFFSFPHIAIDSEGKVGAISRANRPGASAACGALIKTMLDLKAEGVDDVVGPGQHDPLEPEYSILKSRMARRIKYEKMDPSTMDLVDFTKVAERVITTVRHAGRFIAIVKPPKARLSIRAACCSTSEISIMTGQPCSLLLLNMVIVGKAAEVYLDICFCQQVLCCLCAVDEGPS